MSIKSCEFQLPAGKLAGITYQSNSSEEHWLAIHGWLDNAASFMPLIELNELNITAIDLPGHGLSFHRPEHSYYHFIDWLTDLLALIEHISPNKPVNIIGHSLGGLVGTALAGLFPEKVAKLVVIDAAGLVTQNPNEPVKEIRQGLLSRQSIKNKTTKFYPSLDSLVKARALAGELDNCSAQLLMERNSIETEHGFQLRTDPRLKTMSPIKMSLLQAQAIIQNITAKVLILKAKQGYDMVTTGLRMYQQDYQDLTVVEVDGHHHCHMTHPAQIISAINNTMK